MRSIATVTVAPAATRLSTLERVKQELSISDSSSDALLTSKLDEASADIDAHLGRALARATLTETFWGEPGYAEYLLLERTPVASITSVTVDAVAVSASEYRLDGDSGLLYRLDADGYPDLWSWCESVVIVYKGGFILPGEDDRDLPYSLEAAALELVTGFWLAKGRDPLIKAEEIPGVSRLEYWVGAVGSEGDLPPNVLFKIGPYRRVRG